MKIIARLRLLSYRLSGGSRPGNVLRGGQDLFTWVFTADTLGVYSNSGRSIQFQGVRPCPRARQLRTVASHAPLRFGHSFCHRCPCPFLPVKDAERVGSTKGFDWHWNQDTLRRRPLLNRFDDVVPFLLDLSGFLKRRLKTAAAGDPDFSRSPFSFLASIPDLKSVVSVPGDSADVLRSR